MSTKGINTMDSKAVDAGKKTDSVEPPSYDTLYSASSRGPQEPRSQSEEPRESSEEAERWVAPADQQVPYGAPGYPPMGPMQAPPCNHVGGGNAYNQCCRRCAKQQRRDLRHQQRHHCGHNNHGHNCQCNYNNGMMNAGYPQGPYGPQYPQQQMPMQQMPMQQHCHRQGPRGPIGLAMKVVHLPFRGVGRALS